MVDFFIFNSENQNHNDEQKSLGEIYFKIHYFKEVAKCKYEQQVIEIVSTHIVIFSGCLMVINAHDFFHCII